MENFEVVDLVDGKKVIIESVSHWEDQTFIRMSNNLIMGIVTEDVELDDAHETMLLILRRGKDNAYHYTGDIYFDTKENFLTLWQVNLFIAGGSTDQNKDCFTSTSDVFQ